MAKSTQDTGRIDLSFLPRVNNRIIVADWKGDGGLGVPLNLLTAEGACFCLGETDIERTITATDGMIASGKTLDGKVLTARQADIASVYSTQLGLALNYHRQAYQLEHSQAQVRRLTHENVTLQAKVDKTAQATLDLLALTWNVLGKEVTRFDAMDTLLKVHPHLSLRDVTQRAAELAQKTDDGANDAPISGSQREPAHHSSLLVTS